MAAALRRAASVIHRLSAVRTTIHPNPNTATFRHFTSSSPSPGSSARYSFGKEFATLFEGCEWLTQQKIDACLQTLAKLDGGPTRQQEIDASLKTLANLYHVHYRNAANPSVKDNSNSFGEDFAPDAVPFEGCDYKHWLVTMYFPQYPAAPTREEKIETYLQTLAKVVGSYKKAKKKMYAFSTTTYTSFQCLVSKEESDKLRGMPQVVFVLPDTYINPVRKEYGGDKYEDGVITPRPSNAIW